MKWSSIPMWRCAAEWNWLAGICAASAGGNQERLEEETAEGTVWEVGIQLQLELTEKRISKIYLCQYIWRKEILLIIEQVIESAFGGRNEGAVWCSVSKVMLAQKEVLAGYWKMLEISRAVVGRNWGMYWRIPEIAAVGVNLEKLLLGWQMKIQSMEKGQ